MFCEAAGKMTQARLLEHFNCWWRLNGIKYKMHRINYQSCRY